MIRHTWSFEIPRSPTEIWPVVSDTDRLNRSLGLGLSFEESRGPDGSLHRAGSIARFGLTVRWSERDFAFVAPERFAQERVYDNGPVKRTAVSCVLVPSSAGTTVTFVLEVEARSFLVRPIVAADTRLSTRPAFDRSLAELERLLNGQPNAYDPPPPDLKPGGLARLDRGLAEVPQAVAEALRGQILKARLPDQARLRPLKLARELELDDEEVVLAFLRGVRDGALEVGFEILCPSCKAPKGGSSTLSLDLGTHCTSCDVAYDATFPDAVDVVFRPHRDIREVELDVACLLSPARTPHVLLQDLVPAGATASPRRSWRLDGWRPSPHPSRSSSTGSS
ncbi:MAG: SRPBCC family protein, partial [Myxococcales bacterium]|nr:SRPBCC family protein [Myxococcales bacterium]